MDPNKAFIAHKYMKKRVDKYNVFQCVQCGWKQIVNKDEFFNCRCTHCGYEGNGFTLSKM